MINLRSKNKGSIEPFLLYLFKGGLIFESLLKHFNKNDSSPNLGAFFNNKVNRDKYGVEHRDIYERDLRINSAGIIECSNSQSGVKAAFPIAYYVRNLLGHDLKRQDEFDKADDFRCLNNQIIDALLCIVAKEIDPRLVPLRPSLPLSAFASALQAKTGQNGLNECSCRFSRSERVSG